LLATLAPPATVLLPLRGTIERAACRDTHKELGDPATRRLGDYF